MGVSVIAGFATTFLASCVLMMTKLAFFTKFGTYICLTIIWALLVSLGMFTPLMLLIGPEQDQVLHAKYIVEFICSGTSICTLDSHIQAKWLGVPNYIVRLHKHFVGHFVTVRLNYVRSILNLLQI